MTRGVPELEAAVAAALTPAWSDVVRAKKAITQILGDGKPHGIRTLQACLLTADGVPVESAHREKLQLASADDIEAIVSPGHPLIARPRLALAATEALLDLRSQGFVIEVAEAPEHAAGNPIVGTSISVPYQLAGYGAAVHQSTALPNLARAYRLAPRLVDESTQWFFDPDVFTADLERLELDRRARRCIVEALAAYRRGLFLSCASLLGAASEGAWYAAGEQLRYLDAQLDKALDADNTARVMARVTEVLRQHRALRSTIDELHAQAALLRQLRNYGIHPRPHQVDHLERYFSDSGAALLLMETYTYLKRLGQAVATRVTTDDTPDG